MSDVRETVVVILLMFICGCACPGREKGEVPVDVQPLERFVTVNGARLHVVDWGGTGPVLTMIHGMGDSPRIFDDVAPLLQDDFRVIAYARRGHGQSEAVGPFDTDTLVEDLRGVLDQMGVQQSHLLGWSMGGNEITAFATRYPERTLKLVYLEAGYDWSDPAFWQALGICPVSLAPDEAALQNRDTFRAWARTFWLPEIEWTQGLEKHLEQVTRTRPDGTVQPVPGEAVSKDLLGGLSTGKRNYTGISSPALALYSPVFFKTDGRDPELQQAMAEWDDRYMVPFREASKEKIRRELAGVEIQVIPDRTHGTIGVKEPEKLAAIISSFLLKTE